MAAVFRNDPYQSFGGGNQLCLGAWLVRAEGAGSHPRIATLLAEQTFAYHPVPSFRSLKKLWVSRG
jgi:cytochrome P450